METNSPTIMYWNLILRYETLILVFIRTHREKNFSLFVVVLEKLTPLFIALDHVNYSRWMLVHIRDMKCLLNPINEAEKQCHWVISMTNNKFSATPIGLAHEPENAYVKSPDGRIGLTENPVPFGHRVLSGLELSILQRQFEEEYLPVLIKSTHKFFRTMSRMLQNRRYFKSR